MAHTSKNPTLGRKSGPRSALYTMQCMALLQHKRIRTTLSKAKALARRIAPIITRSRTRAKKDSNHAYREAFASLKNKEAVKLLFNEVLPAIGERPGGYTRIIKLGKRQGDGAKMAEIELVDFNLLYQKPKRSKTRRRQRKSTTARGPQTSGIQKKEAADASAALSQGPTPEGDTAKKKTPTLGKTNHVVEKVQKPPVEPKDANVAKKQPQDTKKKQEKTSEKTAPTAEKKPEIVAEPEKKNT